MNFPYFLDFSVLLAFVAAALPPLTLLTPFSALPLFSNCV
jgi:hypothetical protein